jgi:hypothetical protein
MIAIIVVPADKKVKADTIYDERSGPYDDLWNKGIGDWKWIISTDLFRESLPQAV